MKDKAIRYTKRVAVPELGDEWSSKLEYYINARHKGNRNFEPMILKFLKFCDIKGGRLLEIGCGSGWFRKYLKDVDYTGLEVLLMEGIDYDFPVILGPGEKIPSPDASFDHVLILATLDHVADPQKAINESYRILKDGGSIYILNSVKVSGLIRKIFTYSFLALQKLLSLDIESILRNAKKTIGIEDDYHTFEFTAGNIRKMLSNAGYCNQLQRYFLNVSFFKAIKKDRQVSLE